MSYAMAYVLHLGTSTYKDKPRYQLRCAQQQRHWLLCLSLGLSVLMLASLAHLDREFLRLRGKFAVRIGEEQWAAAEAAKADMPKDPTYSSMTEDELRRTLPIYVLSLKGMADRRASATAELKKAGVTQFEFVDAFDGAGDNLDPDEVRKYINGVRFRVWKRGQPYQRRKVAIDLSHYQLLERILKENRTTLILEDDLELKTHNLYADLLKNMRLLPQDWQALYPYTCYYQRGAHLGERLYVMRAGVCTLGYLIKPNFAKVVLEIAKKEARRGFGVVVDVEYAFLIREQTIQAYMIDPPLLTGGNHNSTIDYNKKTEGVSRWEKPFIE